MHLQSLDYRSGMAAMFYEYALTQSCLYQNFFHWVWLLSHVLTIHYLTYYSFTITSIMLHNREKNVAKVHLYRHGTARLCLQYAIMNPALWLTSVLLLPLRSVVTSNRPVFTVNTRLWLHLESQMAHVNMLTASHIKQKCKGTFVQKLKLFTL